MYPQILRHAIFPALDAVNRTHIESTLSWLEKSQWFDRATLLSIQQRKLNSILAFAEDNVDFYRSLWREAASSRRATSLYAKLDGLPVITKNDLRPVLSQFPLPGYRGRVFKVATSGSTGEPMTFYRSAEQESWFWALRLRMWQWGGYVFGEPYLTLNLNARDAWAKRFQDLLFRCCYHGFNANSHDVDAALRDLHRYGVRHLIGYASSLYLLARAMRERGVHNPGVSTIMATGDTLFVNYRKTIEEVFESRVTDYYGAGGEGFHLASQCERGGQYHTHTENSVIELLTDGRPATPGEMGEIVVTQLDNRAMPLIRYATGDLAVVSKQQSYDCGRQLALIESIQGRVPDIVFAPDGSCLVVHFFTILFEHTPEVRQFQVIQELPERITIRIVQGVDYRRVAIEAKLSEAIDKATSGSLSVEFEYCDDIPLSR